MGIYYLEGGANQLPSKVVYDREYSAISLAKPGDIDWDKVKYGDVNQDGYVDSADIVVINKYLLSQVEYPMKNATAMENADCDRDGEITTKDSFVIINCALGLINESQIGK